MSLKHLSAAEADVVLQCMREIAEGTEIEDWEFQTRLGIDRPTLKRIIATWPDINDSTVDSSEFLAINNCLNEVCHGLYIPDWQSRFAVGKTEVERVYRKWLGTVPGGIR
jgi:hypothetical protein